MEIQQEVNSENSKGSPKIKHRTSVCTNGTGAERWSDTGGIPSWENGIYISSYWEENHSKNLGVS